MYSVNEQSFKQVLADISLVTDQLSIDRLHKRLVFKRFTVVDITRGNHEVQEFSTLVAYQVQLESEEPAHRTFASLRYASECLMDMDSLVLAYT